MGKVFQFSKRKTGKLDIKPRPKEILLKDENDEPAVADMYIQRKKATAPEWRAGKALDKLGLTYAFQYSILGGRTAGGQVIDFFIYTVPLPTPMNIQGEYWHRAAKNYRDTLKMNQANDLFNNSANQLVMAWERDLGSVDDAYATMKRLLGGW